MKDALCAHEPGWPNASRCKVITFSLQMRITAARARGDWRMRRVRRKTNKKSTVNARTLSQRPMFSRSLLSGHVNRDILLFHNRQTEFCGHVMEDHTSLIPSDANHLPAVAAFTWRSGTSGAKSYSSSAKANPQRQQCQVPKDRFKDILGEVVCLTLNASPNTATTTKLGSTSLRDCRSNIHSARR